MNCIFEDNVRCSQSEVLSFRAGRQWSLMHDIWSIKISTYISDWPNFPSSVCSCNSINMDGTLMRKAMQAEPENYMGQIAAGQYWTWGTRSRGTAILVIIWHISYFKWNMIFNKEKVLELLKALLPWRPKKVKTSTLAISPCLIMLEMWLFFGCHVEFIFTAQMRKISEIKKHRWY